MQDILKEYGPALITIVAIVALVAVVRAVIGTDANGIVGQAFTSLMSNFFNDATGHSVMGGVVVNGFI